jgi:hypothetical protein
VLDEVDTANKEAVDKRAAEEATAKKAAEERAGKEATVKAAAAEATGAAVGSPAPGQVPSAVGAKRVVAPSGSTPLTKCRYRGVWKPRFVQLSLPLFSFFLFFVASFSYYPLCLGPLPLVRRPLRAWLP